jgi:hypothetical protein
MATPKLRLVETPDLNAEPIGLGNWKRDEPVTNSRFLTRAESETARREHSEAAWKLTCS